MQTLADGLRKAILRSGQSANEIAKQTGISQSTLSRFLRGEDMGIHRASIIAKHLRLKLELPKKPERR